MTATTIGLVEPVPADVRTALEDVLVPRLLSLLTTRQAGHCMRVTELETDLALRLVQRLRTATLPGTVVCLLAADQQVREDTTGSLVSSTKLVELRNRPVKETTGPLLVFVPPGLRASAEDSFGVATFEEVALGDAYRMLRKELLAKVPAALRDGINWLRETLAQKNDGRDNDRAWVHYLLTIAANDYEPDAAGAAVYRFGLVPDLGLFASDTDVASRIGHNRMQVDQLSRTEFDERQRVLGLGLPDSAFTAKLAGFAGRIGLEDRNAWTRRIITDRENRELTFDKWPAPRSREVAIGIDVHTLDLPRVGDNAEHLEKYPALKSLAGHPYLVAGANGTKTLTAQFKVDTPLTPADGLLKLRAEIVSEDGGPTGRAVSVAAGAKPKSDYKATARNLHKADLDEGWHALAVTPVAVADRPVVVKPGTGSSEAFFVVRADEDEEPPERKATRYESVLHAVQHIAFARRVEGKSARDLEPGETAWSTPAKGGLQVSASVHIPGGGNIEVRLSERLTHIERKTLLAPAEVGLWQLSISQDGTPTEPRRDETDWASGLGPEAEQAFGEVLSARDRLFANVLGVVDDDHTGEVVETADLIRMRTQITEYAAAFQKTLEAQATYVQRADSAQKAMALRALAGLQQLDGLAITYIDGLGTLHRLLLLGPTHPLRLLWLSEWAALGAQWRADLDGQPRDAAANAQASFFGRLDSLGFPFAVPRQDGRLLATVGNLTPFWAAYLPSGADDSHGLVDKIARALGVPAAARGSGAESTSLILAERIERYVRQHPYVRTLVLNIVNPGDASLIVEVLLELQRRPNTKHLTYDLRLCTDQTEMPGIGDTLAELTRSDSRFNSDEAEAFGTRQARGAPKLAYSVRSLEEFEESPEEFEAHLTILIDAFAGEEHDTARLQQVRQVPAHGFVQQATTSFHVDDEGAGVTWRKTPLFASTVRGTGDSGELLVRLPRDLALSAAAVATKAFDRVPTTTLTLDAVQRSLLHQAHDTSDWVIVIDRTLGLEYFDRADDRGSNDYVIDYVASRTGLGRQVLVSSRKLDELRRLLAPVVGDHGIEVDDRHLQTFFEQIRLLSGSLAFKLASAARSQRSEVLGLALARIYLEGQRVLGDQIVVPLDAHQELYVETRRRSAAAERSLRRTDLALFSFDALSRTITCRLVEVKAYSTIPDVAAYERLQTEISEQIATSEKVLKEQFAADLADPDRVDRTVKNLELATLLRFYLERAERYRMVNRSVGSHARRLLETLDDGFTLRFERAGLIFDLSGDGSDPEEVGGVEFHHIGRDEIDQLLGTVPTEPDRPGDATEPYSITVPALSRTRRADAAFRAPTLEPLVEEEAEARALLAVAAHAAESSVQTDTSAVEPPPSEAEEAPSRALPEPALEPQAEVAGAGEVGASGADVAVVPAEADRAVPRPDILVGVTGDTPQWTLLGEVAGGRKTALDLNETHTLSLFGVQGGGKSYTLGSIIEGATLAAPGINHLPRPLATIVFHYSSTQDAPEFTSMIAANDHDRQLTRLRERYGAEPAALEDVLLLAPTDQLDTRRREFPGIDVQPLLFGSDELHISHWKFLLGAVGNQSMYLRQLTQIFRAHRADLSLGTIRNAVAASAMPDSMKDLAQQRLDLASFYIDDSVRISDYVRPGRLIIVDLRDELIEKDESLGLFVVLMQLFARATDDGGHFNKLVVFDEAHKYIDSRDLVDVLVESVREMRHKGMSILVASQDPPSVPVSLIELSDVVIMHKTTSPAWLKHIQKANAALMALRPEQLANLQPGEAYLWAGKATERSMTHGAVRVTLRPRLTRHGGTTKTAHG
ncbi:methylation-associated defense system ATP-binding protein MAD8 [Micromonospora aurantiaca (nom. illeg.)]|uniref:methylation-associated defense system ATP-binding protein MAD8 n=1 Tax=Micromonospora aurantiaca (nom. illeg.) TaxID=47850 RepID=UPI0016569F6D|nr:ATP-binding protein [Micromonospora aurantiaca]MBC9001763.1 ATP-binding protein [Micromonospora aurantiaca]